MLADSKIPTTFWAKAVNTAYYVQNRVLVTKPHNKTPYELFLSRKLALGFMRPFRCPIIILNTIDNLGKFDGKADEGIFVRYLINSKAFKVFNSRTRIVEGNLHVQFSENTPNILGSGPNWLFDIDTLIKSMNYNPVVAGNQSNGNAGTKACDDAGKGRMETVPGKDYSLLPLWTTDPPFSQSLKSSSDAGFKPLRDDEKKVTEELGKEGGDSSKDSVCSDQEKEDNVNNTNNVNAASTNEVNAVGGKSSIELPNDPNMPALEDYSIFDLSSDNQDVGAEADMKNLDVFMPFSPIPTTRVHKDHLVEQIIGDLNSTPQTRRMTKNLEEHGLFSLVQQRTNHKDFQNCLFACFLSQVEPKKVIQALQDPRWIEAMQDEMDVKSAFLYGKIEEEVYVCQPPGFEDPDFPNIVYKVEKALYGLHQAPRVWYETLSTYLLNNGFQRGKIDKTLFIRNDKGNILLVQVYVDDIIFGSTMKSLCIEFEKMMHKKFQMSYMGELTFFLGLQVKQKENEIFISQDKYVTDILKKFSFTDVKTAEESDHNRIHYEAVYEEMVDSLERATTTATRLDAEQDRGNINKTQSKATLNEPSSIGTSSSSGLRRQDTIWDTIAQTGVLALETTKTTQAMEITSLKRRVKKLKRRNKSRTHGLKRLYKVGSSRRVESSDEGLSEEDASKQGRKIDDIDADEGITLVDETTENQRRFNDEDIFDVDTLTGDEVFAEQEVVVKDVNLSVDEVTLAQALAALKKSAKPKDKGDVIEEQSVPVSAASTKAKVQDKGKGKMVEEPVKSMKKKYLIRLDEEIASKLQAEFDEEERLKREKNEANIALTEEWNDI
ncbi:putative ribonuclease H-like domain-containing protein [Tanacetum coccineum]